MNIYIVVAIATNNAIGKNNQLLWHLPNDLKHFKEITSGHTVIMGRKTYESVGRPLPKRRNIVVTRQAIEIPGCEVASSIQEAIAIGRRDSDLYIIGGAEIYRQALPLTDSIYLTIVHQAFEADTFFPEIKPEEWLEVSRENHEPDEKNPLPYSFVTLKRR
ncbi:dihydrofolate reductase [Mucilaginibacter sp. CSA2-8R]|uniref:dihydrofolate reductase n=1 Tax=Mucilaginibacter sp. CSA2-8R TaxID=3141542 RepID=UPI00315C55EB